MLDGFHRFEAAKRATGLVPFDSLFVNAFVADCTEDKALGIALTFNTSHGLRRSNDDKRKAVRLALELSELRFLSDRDLAKRLSVSPPFVAKVRGEMARPKKQPTSTSKSHNAENEHGVKIFSPEGDSLKTVEPEFNSANEPEEAYDEREAMIDLLTTENQNLNDRLADRAFVGTEEEKQALHTMIEDLRAELDTAYKDLKLANMQKETISISRNGYLNENAELKRQIKYWEKRTKKLEKLCSDHGINV